MISSSSILKNISSYLLLIEIQMLWRPIQIESDLSPIEKLNAILYSDEWMSLSQPQGPVINRVIGEDNRDRIYPVYQLK